MNNMFPFIPQMYLPNQQNPSFNHIEEELKNMKQEINILKEKVKLLRKIIFFKKMMVSI